MKETVLVIGGAGYIGSQVVLDLYERGCEIIVLDDLSSGYRQLVKAGELVEADLGDDDVLDRLFSERQIDVVMHFAAFSKVEESVAKPLEYWRNNIASPLTLLSKMKEHAISRFIFSSSAAVYGNPNEVPITEDHPFNPINPYGATKSTLERILSDIEESTGIRSISLRYFNAAGADPSGRVGDSRKIKTHLVPLVLEAAGGERDHIKIFGTDYPTHDGTCIRDYIHVSDLSKAHLFAMDYLLDGGSSESFNLGNRIGHSVKEVIQCARKVTGHEIKAVEADRRPGDPAILVASSDKIMKTLGWKPKYEELEKIIETAWNWYLHGQQR